MNLQLFQSNRARFTLEELAPYDGKWVAFSEDGSRIVASAPDLLSLDRKVIAEGEDPERVGLERIVLDEPSVGGSEFL